MELIQWQMQSIHGLAVHSPESNKSSRWSLMDLVDMESCSIRWVPLWSTESTKIKVYVTLFPLYKLVNKGNILQSLH